MLVAVLRDPHLSDICFIMLNNWTWLKHVEMCEAYCIIFNFPPTKRKNLKWRDSKAFPSVFPEFWVNKKDYSEGSSIIHLLWRFMPYAFSDLRFCLTSTRYIRYQSWTVFQEQSFCRPKTEIYLNFSQPWSAVCAIGPIRLLAWMSLWSLTNQIVCFCTHFENFGWHKPCWGLIGILYLTSTHRCKFLEQEVGEGRAFVVPSPRGFPRRLKEEQPHTFENSTRFFYRGVNFWVRKSVKTGHLSSASPRMFPLSVCATFRREFQITTHNSTPLIIVL